MKIKALAVLGVVAMLATAPEAFAFGGGGKKGGGGGGGLASVGSVSTVSAAVKNGPGPNPGPISAPEPLAGLAVGLGLLGARLLRRK